MCSAKSFSKSVAQTWPLWATQTWLFWVLWCIELPQGTPAHCCFSPGRSHKSCVTLSCCDISLARPYGGESLCTDAAATEQSFWGSFWASWRPHEITGCFSHRLGDTGLDKKCWNQGLFILCFGITPKFFSGKKFNPLSVNLESLQATSDNSS